MTYKIVNPGKLTWIRRADTILDKIFPKSNTSPLPIAAPKNILVVRLAYIGDAILTQPVFKVIREAYPQARIDFLTGVHCKPLFQQDPAIDRVIAWDAPWFYKTDLRSGIGKWLKIVKLLRKENYDLAIDFRGDLRNIGLILWAAGIPVRVSYDSGGGRRLLTHPVKWVETKHKALFHLDILKAIGLKVWESPIPKISVHGPTRVLLKQELEFRGIQEGKFIVIHPGSRLPLKQWPIEKYVKLAQKILEKSIQVIVIGSSEEKDLASTIANQSGSICFAGGYDLTEVAAILSLAKLAITNDSAPMHLSAAVGTPVIGIFGPSNPEETAPLGYGSRAVSIPMECRKNCYESQCTNPSGPVCIRDISVDAVLEAMEDLHS